MAKKRKFVTEAGLARWAARRMGFSNLTEDKGVEHANAPTPIRRVDLGNVARCAAALEGIERHLKDLAASSRDRNELERILQRREFEPLKIAGGG